MQAGQQEPVAKRHAKKAEGLIECSLAEYLAANPRAKTTDRAGEEVKDTEIGRLQKKIEDRAGGLLDERDRMIQQRLWLQNELDNVGAG